MVVLRFSIGQGTRILLFVVIATAVVVVWQSASAVQGQEGSTGATYEETRHLTGSALIEALDLRPIVLDDPGAPIDPSQVCEPTSGAALIEVGDALYCTSGVAGSKLEAWELGERMKGRFPTDAEIERMASLFGEE